MLLTPENMQTNGSLNISNMQLEYAAAEWAAFGSAVHLEQRQLSTA